MTVAVIGRGRVGRGLVRQLRAREHSVSIRSTEAAAQRAYPQGTRILVLAVPDAVIEDVATSLVGKLPKRVPVVHCAGSRPPEALRVLRGAGHPVGVMHPLVSFPSRTRSPSLVGTTFTLAGDKRAIQTARTICRAVGAIPLQASVTGASYHASAALVANGAAALAFAGVTLLEGLGIERSAASRALGGLLRTVGENVEELGVPAALTGPIARGDLETVKAHRRALRGEAKRAYDRIGPLILTCARRAGLADDRARQMARIFRAGRGRS